MSMIFWSTSLRELSSSKLSLFTSNSSEDNWSMGLSPKVSLTYLSSKWMICASSSWVKDWSLLRISAVSLEFNYKFSNSSELVRWLTFSITRNSSIASCRASEIGQLIWFILSLSVNTILVSLEKKLLLLSFSWSAFTSSLSLKTLKISSRNNFYLSFRLSSDKSRFVTRLCKSLLLNRLVRLT